MNSSEPCSHYALPFRSPISGKEPWRESAYCLERAWMWSRLSKIPRVNRHSLESLKPFHGFRLALANLTPAYFSETRMSN